MGVEGLLFAPVLFDFPSLQVNQSFMAVSRG